MLSLWVPFGRVEIKALFVCILFSRALLHVWVLSLRVRARYWSCSRVPEQPEGEKKGFRVSGVRL